MDAVVVFFLFSICGILQSSACPSREDIAPCICRRDKYTRVYCKNILRPEDLIPPMRALENSRTTVSLLEISDSSLVYLPDKLFQNTHIERVYFEDSEIMSLSESDTAFDGLEEILKDITAKRVKQISHWNFNQLRNLKKLYSLELKATLMGAVDHALPYLPNLGWLNISGSDISYITDDAFSKLPKLREFFMMDNKITELKRSMFPNPATNLLSIDLRGNLLSYLPDDFFENMPNLLHVILDKNKFMSVSEKPFLVALRKCSLLSIKDNPIRCDCRLQWLVNVRFPPKFYGNCATPKSLNGRSLNKLNLKSLLCI